MKRGDRGRRRTLGRIKRGDGNGGEPVRPDWDFAGRAWPGCRLCHLGGARDLERDWHPLPD